MKLRPLKEIYAEIADHEAAIKELREEIKTFQQKCPHPENFQDVVRSSSTDEYGSLDGYFITTTCILCERKEYREESVERSTYR